METDTEKNEKPKDDVVPKLTKEDFYTGIKVLFRYVTQYRKPIITLSILGIVSAIGNGIIPYIAGRFFDAISSTATVDIFGVVVPLFIGVLMVWTLVQTVTYIVDWRSSNLSNRFSNTIWIDYIAQGFNFLLELPISFHKKHKIGDISQKINTAGNMLETIAGNIIIDLSPQLLSIVIALIVSFFIKPLLAIFLVGGVFLYIAVFVRMVRPLAGYQKKYWSAVNDFFGDTYDAVGNTLAIKQASAEEFEQHKLIAQGKKIVPLWMRAANVWSGLSLYQKFMILITQIAIFLMSVYYIHQGSMTIGELLAFNAYAGMVFGPFVTIARNWQTIQNGLINIQETEKILSLPTEIYEPKGSSAFKVEGSISFNDVSFEYDPDKLILEHISFSTKPGQIIALVGESGVGKSTLIDLVSGYHFPTHGTVTIDGRDIHEVNLRSLRSQIAVVPQEVVLFNDTIETNIKYGNFKATEEEVRQAAVKAHAFDFIEKFPDQWKQAVGERGIKLSVGQKQRVAIARAILRDPAILVLDEPTSALDAGSEKIITDSLHELMKGKTTFIIAHRLSTVRTADSILVFKDKKIIESGTHDELLRIEGGEYRRLYELQIGLHG